MQRRKRPAAIGVRARVMLPIVAAALHLGACADKEPPDGATARSTDRTAPADAAGATSAGSGLAGTTWRLVELQSMDDAQGTTRPADPSRFTLRLNADGSADLRLDCNQASGTWTATPSADPSNGSFTFGPLATTKALCPPPQLDERIAAQLAYVRGYLLRDGRLNLSLMADGGILVWEPVAAKASTERESDAALEATTHAARPEYHAVGVSEGRNAHTRVDLNDDGALPLPPG